MKERIPQYRAYGADLRTGVERDKECRYDGNIDLLVEEHLTKEQIEPVTKHIESCPACHEYFDEVSRYKKLISGNFAPPTLADLVHNNEIVLATVVDEPEVFSDKLITEILSHYADCKLCSQSYQESNTANKYIQRISNPSKP